MVVETAGESDHRLQVGIALEQVLQGFPHGVAVDVIHGLGAHGRPVEVGENGVVKSDVGLPGIKQHPVAIEGYQFYQKSVLEILKI